MGQQADLDANECVPRVQKAEAEFAQPPGKVQDQEDDGLHEWEDDMLLAATEPRKLLSQSEQR